MAPPIWGELPGLPAVGAQPLSDRSCWKRCKVADPANAELGELLAPAPVERQELERQRGEKAGRAPVLDHERLAWPSDVRSRQGREPPLGRAGTRIPTRAHGGKSAAERPLDAAVEALNAACIEVRATLPNRFYGDADVLEPADDLLPCLLRPGRIRLDERKRGTGGQRLP